MTKWARQRRSCVYFTAMGIASTLRPTGTWHWPSYGNDPMTSSYAICVCRSSLAQEQPQLLPRFIFVTGDTLSPVAKAFLEDSQAPYLVKPFHAEEVRRVVQQALHRLEGL